MERLPDCYRCGKQPCECKEILATLRRLILEALREHRRMNGEQISDEIETLYRRAEMPVPWLLIEAALWGLVCGRRVKRAKGKWEGEYWYSLRPRTKKPTNRLRQEVMF